MTENQKIEQNQELLAPPPRPIGFSFDPKLWLADNLILTMSYAEQGMHLKLMCLAWQETPPCTLPKNDKWIAQLLGIAEVSWVSHHKKTILAAWKPYKTETGEERWVNDGLQRSYEKQAAVSVARSLAAQSRWKKDPLPTVIKVEESQIAQASLELTLPDMSAEELKTNDPTAYIWKVGLLLLAPQKTEQAARPLIGRWCKQYGESVVASVLAEVSLKASTVADRYTYITAALAQKQKLTQKRKKIVGLVL